MTRRRSRLCIMRLVDARHAHTQNAFAILEDNTRREGGRKKDQTNKSTTLAMQLAMGW